MLEDKDDIKTALSTHFSEIGKNTNLNQTFKEKTVAYLKNIDDNIMDCENMFTLVFSRDKIESLLKGLRSGKAPGIDGIPNEF